MSTLNEPNRAAVMGMWEQVHVAVEQRLGLKFSPMRSTVEAILSLGVLNAPARADLEAFFLDMIDASHGDAHPPVLPAKVTANQARFDRIMQALAAG